MVTVAAGEDWLSIATSNATETRTMMEMDNAQNFLLK
jgi:hypothetical protein